MPALRAQLAAFDDDDDDDDDDGGDGGAMGAARGYLRGGFSGMVAFDDDDDDGLPDDDDDVRKPPTEMPAAGAGVEAWAELAEALQHERNALQCGDSNRYDEGPTSPGVAGVGADGPVPPTFKLALGGLTQIVGELYRAAPSGNPFAADAAAAEAAAADPEAAFAAPDGPADEPVTSWIPADRPPRIGAIRFRAVQCLTEMAALRVAGVDRMLHANGVVGLVGSLLIDHPLSSALHDSARTLLSLALSCPLKEVRHSVFKATVFSREPYGGESPPLCDRIAAAIKAASIPPARRPSHYGTLLATARAMIDAYGKDEELAQFADSCDVWTSMCLQTLPSLLKAASGSSAARSHARWACSRVRRQQLRRGRRRRAGGRRRRERRVDEPVQRGDGIALRRRRGLRRRRRRRRRRGRRRGGAALLARGRRGRGAAGEGDCTASILRAARCGGHRSDALDDAGGGGGGGDE